MKSYRALSIVAPGGDRIRSGEKRLEVRRWRPEIELPLRDLLIVQNRVRLGRGHGGVAEDSDGEAVALVDVVAVREWLECELEAACGSYWEPGWLAWELANVRAVRPEEPVVARLGIYEVQCVLEIES